MGGYSRAGRPRSRKPRPRHVARTWRRTGPTSNTLWSPRSFAGAFQLPASMARIPDPQVRAWLNTHACNGESPSLACRSRQRTARVPWRAPLHPVLPACMHAARGHRAPTLRVACSYSSTPPHPLCCTSNVADPGCQASSCSSCCATSRSDRSSAAWRPSQRTRVCFCPAATALNPCQWRRAQASR
jgi:hypothetical protein